ncbi:hypothetical protein FKP32DRAFT_1641855 [Trametes sanguinea]|nr:hypothetical protein FKP32DRAFT_1641855 [Trametes sanguinea]
MPYSESSSRLMLIDDRDPAVQYEGSWERDVYFGDSLSATTADKASVALEFDGSRIIVAALGGPDDKGCTTNPTMQFMIDGVLSDTITAQPMANWTFYDIYDSQGLEDGTHTINITVEMPSSSCRFYLDGFMFQPSKKYWDLALAPQDLESTSTDSTAKSKHVPVGAIVGGVLASIVALVLVIGLFFWWRRRRQHAYTSLESPYESTAHRTVTPFTSTRFSSGTTITAESKRNYILETTSMSSSPASVPVTPSSHTVPPSAPSAAGATVATEDPHGENHIGSAPNAVGYDLHQAPHLRSIHGNVGLTGDGEAPSRSGRARTMAEKVQAAIRAARRSTRGEYATPTEAPPQYSE